MFDFQDRVDKLAIAYLEKTCDISSMSFEEYIEKFNEVSKAIISVYQNL